MKTKQLIIIIAVILLPCWAMSQSASKAIFEKYADKEGFTSVIISGDLFQMLVSDDGDVNVNGNKINTKGFRISDIKGIRLLSISNEDGENQKMLESLVNETEAAFAKDKPRYTELVQIQSGKEKINVLGRKEKSKIHELIVYRRNAGEKEVTLIYIEGPFDEEMVNKMIRETIK
ncbi:MAG: DUF4252 domain-containing protein [Prevotellaceae bacterium]|jgi:hypothetical protein|nr:DUF4252 domain-containing protein [Prevotellaceae bacterium]